jgi:hypothetical protein
MERVPGTEPGITAAGHEEIWRNSELLSDAGLRTALASGTDVRGDGTGGLVEQQARVLLAAGIGSEQLRLVCSVLQCGGLPYHAGSRLGVAPVVWEQLDGPRECERVAVEACGSSIRARLLFSAIQHFEAESSQRSAGPAASGEPAASGPPPATLLPEGGAAQDRPLQVAGPPVGAVATPAASAPVAFRPIRASHIGAAASRVNPYRLPEGGVGYDVSALSEDYFEPICETCHRNIASDILGGMECWECYNEH